MTLSLGFLLAIIALICGVLMLVAGRWSRLPLAAIAIICLALNESGLLASLALGRVIGTQLWGVSPYDPWTLTCVPALLIITGLLSCWVPARRAASVDPLVALRYQ